LNDELISKIWGEYAMTTTYSSNVITPKSGNKCPFELLFFCKPKVNLRLRTFGEIVVVTTNDKIQGKLRKRGSAYMFVGYTNIHSRDVFRTLNLETREVNNSRDVVWSSKIYKDLIVKKSTIYKLVEDDNNDLPLIKNLTTVMIHEPLSDQDKEKADVNKRFNNQSIKLDSWFSPQASNVLENYKKEGRLSLN
jgi:hypothetical protein